jgi:Protein of unknown function (DUF1769)
MGKDVQMSEQSSTMMVKVNARPSTTTASGATATNAKGKNAFRFPRFSLKSPSMAVASGNSTTPSTVNTALPRTSRRLRSFPALRLRSMPMDVSDTSVNTSLSPSPPAPCLASSSNSSAGSNSISSRRRNHRRETKEEHARQCTKIYSVQHSLLTSSWEQEEAATSLQQQQSSPNNHNIAVGPPGYLPQQNQLDLTDPPQFSCATAILQHSYLEMVCGQASNALHDDANFTQDYDPNSGSLPPSPTSLRRMPDDPTVKDSIECVFASQLEEGLPLWDDDEYEDVYEHRDEQEQSPLSLTSVCKDPINAPSEAELLSPALFMQSKQKARPTSTAKSMIPTKRRSHPSNNNGISINDVSSALDGQKHLFAELKSGTSGDWTPASVRRRKKYQTAKLVHVGTIDPMANQLLGVAEAHHKLVKEDLVVRQTSLRTSPSNSKTCFCHAHSVPVVPDAYWPQAPLLLRPTPNQGMSVKGVRFSGESEHFWKPDDGGWWITPLYEVEGKEAPCVPPDAPAMCSQCCMLPINNGNEPVGKALVTDFETPLFEGTLLVRLRHVAGGATSADRHAVEYDDTIGYFAGLNRRYQVVIRGKFKKELPFTDLVAGSVMDRPYGRLPPKWIMKGAIKVLSFFAPQLEVELECARPKTMAPLGSTPQALIVQEVGPQDTLPSLDDIVEEPAIAQNSLLGTAYLGNTSLQRARGRKKAFDRLFSMRSQSPMTRTSKGAKDIYYTFEFLQHLVNFEDFSVELGNLLGSIPIAPILSGAPIPIMAMVKEGEQKLWSFDLWHQSLVEGAKSHDAGILE